MSRNLNAVKTFFDPHPGFGGAIIPIPEAIKRVADELSGKTMSLRNAVAKIRKATKGKVSIVQDHNFILLELTSSNGMCHAFRVIRFM